MKKKALILGFGVSGRGAASLLLHQGYSVFVFDDHKKESDLPVTFITDFEDLSPYDCIVVSPGIPQTHPLYAKAVREKRPLCGEMELALRSCKNRAIAVTGTNGKTTTVKMLEHIFNYAGNKARALGNVGESIASYFTNPDPEEILIVELSSFQLETLSAKPFDYAVLLNITEHHLDRYDSFEEYAETKCSLGDHLKEGGIFFVQERVFKTHPQFFHREQVEVFQESPVCILAKKMGIDEKVIHDALQTFKKPFHRIEFVTKIDGVSYYNDSKGTNMAAVIYALERMSSSVVLIAGGVDTKSDFSTLIDAVRKKVRLIVAIGETKEKIVNQLSSVCEVLLASSFEEAVLIASKRAQENESILLSPGCASYDMFRHYEHRGEEFKRLVRELEKRSLVHES